MLRGRTLRYYIGRRFAVMIAGALVVCMTLVFLVDMLELMRRARTAKSLSGADLLWLGFLRLHAFTEILIPFAVLVGSIGALMSLSRRSELAVMRAGGMSVWQVLRPGITVALLVGVLAVAVYNPLSALALAKADKIMADAFGRDSGLLSTGAGNWLRQEGRDGASVMTASVVAEQGLTLGGVTVFLYDPEHRLSETVIAQRAVLRDGYWDLERGSIARAGEEPVKFLEYKLSTALDRSRVRNALGSVQSVSIFDLPDVIALAEANRLPVARFAVQFELLKSRPFLLATMVLLAATVSLRSFRQGGIQTMVSAGIIGGVGFFLLTEVSRQIGLSGLVSAAFSVWAPVVIASSFAVVVLLNQEDG